MEDPFQVRQIEQSSALPIEVTLSCEENNSCLHLCARAKSGDMGIGGYTPEVLGGYPIQVKQSSRVGRNPVDNFETAIRRMNKNKGYIVAYSFSKQAYEEAARA